MQDISLAPPLRWLWVLAVAVVLTGGIYLVWVIEDQTSHTSCSGG